MAQVEGFRTEAYCLDPVKYPLAGVTIGIGVDFGSKTATSLRQIGVSESIITKVSSYFGKKGYAACSAVTAYKAVLTQTEALDLSDKIIAEETKTVASRYNSEKAASSKTFETLTCAQRTVISSVLYQYGSPTVNFKKYRKNYLNSKFSEFLNFGLLLKLTTGQVLFMNWEILVMLLHRDALKRLIYWNMVDQWSLARVKLDKKGFFKYLKIFFKHQLLIFARQQEEPVSSKQHALRNWFRTFVKTKELQSCVVFKFRKKYLKI